MDTEKSLTADSLRKLLAWLDEDELAAAHRYEEIRAWLVRSLAARRCYEAEAVADIVFDRVARKLGEDGFEYIGVPERYIFGVARNVLHEWFRDVNRMREVSTAGVETDRQHNEEELGCLEKCLNKLPTERRRLVLTYYRGDSRERINVRNRLAEKLGISASALQLRVFRLRRQLYGCVKKCLDGK